MPKAEGQGPQRVGTGRKAARRKPPRKPAPAAPPAPAIVGIGASAGGLAAFESFISTVPPETGNAMAFVLVQHLAPDHKSLLTDLVQRHTPMQVVEVTDRMAVHAGHVYIIPPNRDMAIRHATLHLLEPSAPRGMRMPIDFFFRSLAQDQHERAICIVLSGTGSDGVLGLRAVKGEGGMVLVQDPASAEYEGMPENAIATGLADAVLTPQEMPALLLAYVGRAFQRREPATETPQPSTEEAIRKVCDLLRSHTGHDLSQYKQSTLVRRIERRMALEQIERMDDYVRLLTRSANEVHALFRDLLIGVTSFFRDPEVFASLNKTVIPKLCKSKEPGEEVRVWVCGCSTGEEAYSLAILLQENLDRIQQHLKVQMFATDIDKEAIEQARSGVFSASIAADVPPELLARYFTLDPDAHAYRIRRTIRDQLVFSEQDVIKDPPFSKIDLISCRNLMIYMNTGLQQRLIPLFHYALTPGGILLLGPSETIGDCTSLFDVIDRKWKIFRRRESAEGAARPRFGDLAPSRLARAGVAPQQLPTRRSEQVDLQDLVRESLLSHYAQVGILVNGRGDMLHIHGRTGRFLEPGPGDAGVNVLEMARPGLRRELTAALHRAVTEKQPVHHRDLRVQTNGSAIRAELCVRPVHGGAGPPIPDLYLVVLEETVETPVADAAPAEGAVDSVPSTSARITALERELRSKEEYLRTTVEELETSNEELKSANEEMQSVNEELQSTNEELETSKEELQSVNEELATVNAELQNKVAELTLINNDMNNLLAGTGVATLFVDMKLRIARFTPSATQLINLIQGDVGRPVGHIVSNLVGYDTLAADIQSVLDTLETRETEVQTPAGAVFLMRIRPYRTLDNAIEGAVITFVDITDRKRVEEALHESREQLGANLAAMTWMDRLGTQFIGRADRQVILDHVLDAGIALSDADMGDIQLVDGADGTLRIAANRGLEAPLLDHFRHLGPGHGACGAAFDRGAQVAIEDVESSPVLQDTGERAVLLAAGVRSIQSTPMVAPSGRTAGVLSTYHRSPGRPDPQVLRWLDLLSRQAADLLERADAVGAARETDDRIASALDGSGVALVHQDADLRYTLVVNPGLWFDADRAIGRTDHDLLPPREADALSRLKRRVLARGVPARETVRATVDGRCARFDLMVQPHRDEHGQVTGVSSVMIALDPTDE